MTRIDNFVILLTALTVVIPPSAAAAGQRIITSVSQALNQTGSFQIVAYVDTNGNGGRDTNETGAALPLVLVQASLDS